MRKCMQLCLCAFLCIGFLIADLSRAEAKSEKEILHHALRKNRKQFLSCYIKVLKKKPKLEGRVILRFLIQADGKLKSVKIHSSTLGHKGMESCILKVAKTWRFPKRKDGKQLTAVYPYTFTPGPPKKRKATKLGYLPKKTIQVNILKGLKGVLACYKKRLEKKKTIQGKVLVRFQIDAKGRTQRAEVYKSALRDKGLEECLLAHIRKARFPKPKGGGVIKVHYPFTFSFN